MISFQIFKKQRFISLASNQNCSSELSRVFAAAVVDQQFCETLLEDPQQALQNGYLGEHFLLSREEQDLLTSIRAGSLADLAKQVNKALRKQ
ncbi:MAG: hypothetical protein HY863_05610 [Chloroflexi bacterium]|nr:hypothetical protein [Chloroflexota bacterium]